MSAASPVVAETPDAGARLEQSPQWKNLTDQQRLWVIQFLATGSALLATRAAYNAKPTNARVLSYELAKNPSILAALDVAAGRVSPVKSERDRLIAIEQRQRKQLIATVRKQLAAAEEGSIAAAKFSAQLERLQIGIKAGPHVVDDDEPENDSQPTAEASPAQKFFIGQLVTQRDDETGILHTGRILAIDDNGQATKIEEVK